MTTSRNTAAPVVRAEERHEPGKDVRERYASLLQVSPSRLHNLELYHFIDHWYSTPYKWGGNDMGGIDCSGFVWILFREVYGKKIARNSEQIFLTNCEEQSVNKLREGDLVFFKIGGQKIDHVGLYLQNDFFVHATSSRGVVIDKLSDTYWGKKLYNAGSIKED